MISISFTLSTYSHSLTNFENFRSNYLKKIRYLMFNGSYEIVKKFEFMDSLELKEKIKLNLEKSYVKVFKNLIFVIAFKYISFFNVFIIFFNFVS